MGGGRERGGRREGWREEKEGGKEGGTEGRREGGREGRKEGWRERKEGGKEGGRGREGGRSIGHLLCCNQKANHGEVTRQLSCQGRVSVCEVLREGRGEASNE